MVTAYALRINTHTNYPRRISQWLAKRNFNAWNQKEMFKFLAVFVATLSQILTL